MKKEMLLLAPMKTASISTHRYLTRCNIPFKLFGHKLPYMIVQDGDMTEVEYHQSYKAMFVRNPYARILSLYFFTMQNAAGRPKEFTKTEDGWLCKKEAKLIPFDFNGFVNYICRVNPKSPYHAGRRLMSNYIAYNQNIHIDFVGKVETIERDIIRLINERDGYWLDKVLPAFPKFNPTEHGPYVSYYRDKAIQQLVYDTFRPDFEIFGYSKELTP